MKKETLTFDFDCHEWHSEPEDLKSVDSSLAARILFDVLLISEFEHALLKLKTQDCVWGPVHTSVGQEGIAAGTIAALRKSDQVAATYRAHHHFLSKTLQWALPESWHPGRQDFPEEGREVLRRTLGEIQGLSIGYCGGRGGSMHLRHSEAGFIGSNAIVGGGLPLATGVAFAEKFLGTDNIALAFIGDGAVNIGSFHEALNFAGLWRLPFICFIENNSYAVATHVKNACAVKDLVVRANSYNMDGYKVDGSDPLAIYEVVRQAADKARNSGQPSLIVADCYRRYHHAGDQPGSAFGYRSKEEEEQWGKREVVSHLGENLVHAGVLSEEERETIEEKAKNSVAEAVDYCTLPGTPRRIKAELWPASKSATEGLRSNGREWQSIQFTEREQYTEFQQMRYSDVIAAVTERWLEKDPRVIVLGEEIANFGGGAYGATKGLPQKYPDRILNTPIAEAGFTGLALGVAMQGLRPVIEIMFPDFSLVAADQIFNQIGKARHMYGNTTELPIVLRTRVAIGCGYGGQHSMDPVGLYALFPGWRIVAPSDGFDYIGLFNSAMNSLDPVLIIEHHTQYTRKDPVPTHDLDYFIPFGSARVVANGTDVTLVTYSSMVGRCRDLIPRFREKGISVEIVDLRSLDFSSIDYKTLGTSLQKTGALLIVEEAPTSQSIGATISANVTERFFDYLDAPIARVSSLDIPLPVSRVLEQTAMLSDEAILDATIRLAGCH